MKYSQNNEEEIIRSYFAGKKGHLLSLGENDGMTLSNSRALILDGWSADLVEPAKIPFEKLCELYAKRKNIDQFKIRLHNVAIGNKAGKAKFYSSGTLLKESDTDLVSTLIPEELIRWKGSVDFKEEEIDVITFSDLLESTMNNTFDFISIDCEGLDLAILQQMNLRELQCKCLCVEFNGKDEYLFTSYVASFGMRLLHKNSENLIYVR